ncbi:hypothetical protein CVT24_006097 [Panaeolus cyanescens]|uniref:FAS1 domain-containing protein n=1 Tax=Panaeolus cyanescens TaxID=181874 RepID=A0A409V8S3_9AGAR|nr:hypothetical protein CVT24_006097 [Panaeolus cyanescens]
MTLVDALSADPDYTSLITLLQRAKLIPTLNKLNGSTFFAPTNDAIKRHISTNQLWQTVLDISDNLVPDNVQQELRQQLFYHLLNTSIANLPGDKAVDAYQTLLYPHKPPEKPSHDPPPYPPWMPIPGGTLGGNSQRLRVSTNGDSSSVGVDAFGQGGAKITKEIKDAGNGILVGIGDVLQPPPNLATLVSQHERLAYFRKIMPPALLESINSSSAMTLFLPVDEAWQQLHPIERLYLESEFSANDVHRILDMHALLDNRVLWTDALSPGSNLTTLHGNKLEVSKSPEGLKVENATLVQPDIYASNGVLHTVSSLLLPPNALQLTPEKYLLALNCTKFVSLLHSVDLTHLINTTEPSYTILAPSDTVLSVFTNGDLPEPGSDELKRMLQYHFIPGKWTPDKLKNATLLETALQEPGLAGGHQVVSVEVSADDKKGDKKKPADKTIRFGGAGVLQPPVPLQNGLLYLVSTPLIPPPDALQAVLPQLDLSSFLAAVFSTSKADLLRKSPTTSLLVPHNDAFKRLGVLVSAHLLSPAAQDDLENVILHHALTTVEYAHSLQKGSQHSFATLEGSDIKIDRLGNGSIVATGSGGWDGFKTDIYLKDLLTQTGVVHELSDIMVPRSVNINIGKLVRAAKGSTMASLVNRAGFDWILNGTAPPEGSPWADEEYAGVGWTLLCPPDDAFKEYNLTQLYADAVQLQSIVTQHIIPTFSMSVFDSSPNPSNNDRPLIFEDATYSTLRSPSSAYGDIVFQHRTDNKEYVVGIKGARGSDGNSDWARIIGWGRTTTGGGRGGVVQIDRLLIPYQPTWWHEYGAPTAVGVFGVVAICGFFYGVRMLWNRDTTEATYEPVGGFGHEGFLSNMSDASVSEETRVSAAESVKSFIAGGFGGVAAVLVGHPFDLTKTRLQTASPGAYTGAIDVVKKTIARDGITGLYRGMVPPLLGVTPIFAMSFWAYDASKQLIFAVTPNRASESLSIGELAAAGFMSAVPTTLVTAPVERAKVLLQVQGQGGSERQYKGVTDVLKHLYKEGGLRSIFRGAGATLARDGPGSAAYFAAYEITKKALTPAGASSSDLNLGAIILAGGTAGVAMWALAIPPDVIKSRIQSAPTGTYSGMLDCVRKTIAADGVRALWKGFGPAMARAFPANAATFLGVEASRKVLDSLF